jgi:solute carrier family 25 folate transporter 32
MLKEEGIGSFYRGIIPALFGVSHGAIQFMVYEQLKQTRLHQRLDAGMEFGRAEQLGTVEYIAMAATSKVVATVTTYPYQVIKSRQQFYSKQVGVLELISSAWKNEGVFGFYRGLVPNLLRVVPGTCITFASYEFLSSWLKTVRELQTIE